MSFIKFSTLNYREKQQIFVCIRSDCKIADSYLIECIEDGMKA